MVFSLPSVLSKLVDSTPPGTGLDKMLCLCGTISSTESSPIVDREITDRCIDTLNRVDPDLYQFMQYGVNTCDPTIGENYALAKQFGQQLIENCREAVNSASLYKDGVLIQLKTVSPSLINPTVTFQTAPHVEINNNGDIIATEVVREGVRKLEAYVEEMSSATAVNAPINVDKVHDSVLKLWNAVKNKKASRNFVTRPTQVILPLSPNHGLLGNDGLYSESKISLETLSDRWSAES